MQSTLDITIHPLDLSEHGRGPKGQPLYRIVWADSRVDRVIANGRRYDLPRYEHAAGKWVLEKWRSGKDLTSMTPQQWQAFLEAQPFGSAQMEYPTEGDYELSYVFDGSVDPATAHKVAAMIEYGLMNTTTAERLNGIRVHHEQAAKEVDEKMSAVIQTALSRGVQ
jgi:hypothetical protein